MRFSIFSNCPHPVDRSKVGHPGYPGSALVVLYHAHEKQNPASGIDQLKLALQSSPRNSNQPIQNKKDQAHKYIRLQCMALPLRL